MDRNDDTLEAAEEIRNHVGRYCDPISKMDLDTVGAWWTDDDVWTVFGEDRVDRRAILATFRELTSRVDWVVQHASSSPFIEFTGDGKGATGVWQSVEYGRRRAATGPGPGPGMVHLGRYVDRYVQDDGAWKFAARRFETLHYGDLEFT